MKVLHVLYQSFPHITGSSTRSRDLLLSQNVNGIKPVVITSPFQEGRENVDVLFGIKHYRTFVKGQDVPTSEEDKGFVNRIKRILRMPYFIKEIVRVVKEEKPDILHAHATFFCGISAIIVGIKERLPVIYEVRSLWEQRLLEQDKSVKIRIQVKIISLLERYSMLFANHVVVINDHLRKELIKRGIKKKKITIIGNAVNVDNMKQHFKKGIDVHPELVFGYIGGISPIEGLDLLLKVFFKLNKEGFRNKLIIYGDGVFLPELEHLKESLKIKNVIFKGKIANEDVFLAYDEIDVIVNPRRNLIINNTITPLKPLEAMAYGKIVLGSNVNGLKELIKEGVNGYLFEADSLDSLYEKIVYLINSPSEDLQKIRENAYVYIEKERNWVVNGKKYKELYESVIKK